MLKFIGNLSKSPITSSENPDEGGDASMLKVHTKPLKVLAIFLPHKCVSPTNVISSAPQVTLSQLAFRSRTSADITDRSDYFRYPNTSLAPSLPEAAFES